MMDTCHINLSKAIECTTPEVNSKINYGLWEIMMCLGRFIHFDKCTILMSDIDNGEVHACVAGRVLEICTILSILQ